MYNFFRLRSFFIFCCLSLDARLDPVDPVPSFENVPLDLAPAPAIFLCSGLLTRSLCNATSTWLPSNQYSAALLIVFFFWPLVALSYSLCSLVGFHFSIGILTPLVTTQKRLSASSNSSASNNPVAQDNRIYSAQILQRVCCDLLSLDGRGSSFAATVCLVFLVQKRPYLPEARFCTIRLANRAFRIVQSLEPSTKSSYSPSWHCTNTLLQLLRILLRRLFRSLHHFNHSPPDLQAPRLHTEAPTASRPPQFHHQLQAVFGTKRPPQFSSRRLSLSYLIISHHNSLFPAVPRPAAS